VELLHIIFVAYIVALLVNIFVLRQNVAGLGGWFAMLADYRHGWLLNLFALIIFLFPPIIYLILLIKLYDLIEEKVKA